MGRVVDEGEHLRKCWACSWTYGDLYRPGPQASTSQRVYEACVEAIEERRGRGPFRRPELVRATVGMGPTQYNMMGRALHDMRMHGLVAGVQFSTNGRRIEQWEVIV